MKTFADVAPVTETPTTEAAAVDDRVLIVFPLMLVVVDGEAEVRPVTLPAVDERLLIVLPLTLRVVAELELPIVNPVRAAPHEMLVIVLVLTEQVPPRKLTVSGLILPLPPEILLKVFPVMVLVGEPPSVLFIPTKPVAPVTVIFEKLLL